MEEYIFHPAPWCLLLERHVEESLVSSPTIALLTASHTSRALLTGSLVSRLYAGPLWISRFTPDRSHLTVWRSTYRLAPISLVEALLSGSGASYRLARSFPCRTSGEENAKMI